MSLIPKERLTRQDLVLVIDFDVTITKNDLAYDLLDALGSPNWREIESEIIQGKITIREGIQRELGSLKISEEELRDFTLKHAKLDEGAGMFFQWARKNRLPTYILSDGIAQYIDVTIRHLLTPSAPPNDDWKPRIIANKFRWKNENEVDRVIFPNPPCDHGCANCKPYWIQRIKEAHPSSKIIFIGDGYTDRLVAPHVDVIFARKGELLESLLKSQGIPFFSYDNLNEVLDQVKNIHANEKSFF